MTYTPYYDPWDDHVTDGLGNVIHQSTTPITAAALNYIEAGIAAAAPPAVVSAAGDTFTLASSVAAGDLNFTLDRTPTSIFAVNYIIEPFTPRAEVVAPASIATNTITKSAYSLAGGNVQYIAATKTIRLHRNISTIVGNGVTTTVTTTSAHNYTTGNLIRLFGVTAWDDAGSAWVGGMTTGAITVTGATTFTFASTVNASESAGRTVLAGNEWKFNLCAVGEALTISLSPLNSGIFTIVTNPYPTEITVAETIVDENSATASLLKIGLSYPHAAGSEVKAFPKNYILPFEWFNGKPGSSADGDANALAFNTMTRSLYRSNAGGIFLGATFYVTGECCLERDQTLVGVSPNQSGLYAKAGFAFDSTGEVALLHPHRDGQPVTYGKASASGRWWVKNLRLNGQNLANSNGFLSSPQQPDHSENLRLDGFKGKYALCLNDVQQHIMTNIQIETSTVPLLMLSCQFVYIYGLNIEQCDGDALCVMLNSTHNAFYGVHLEPGNETKGFNVGDGCTSNSWYDVYYSNPTVTGDSCFYFNVAIGNPNANARYFISNVWCNAPANDFYIVKDVQRALEINSFSDTNRSISFMAAHDGGYVLLSKNGWEGSALSTSSTARTATDTTDTLVLADASNFVKYTNGAAVTVTIPTNASVAFAEDTLIEIAQMGAGQLTVVGAGGVNLLSDGSKNKTAAQYATMGLWYQGSNNWLLTGDIVA